MEKIEKAIKETLEEAKRIREKIKYIKSDSARVMVHNPCGGGHYLDVLDLKDLQKTVKVMALSKLNDRLDKVEFNIVEMGKAIGFEETE